MRTISGEQGAVYTRGQMKVAVKVEVKDADGTYQELTNLRGLNWVKSVAYQEDVDNQIMQMTIKLHGRQFHYSTAPLDETSALNVDSGGSYAMLLHTWRDIRVYTAVIPIGKPVAAGDWIHVFQGKIDRVKEMTGLETNDVMLSCRDDGGWLQDKWVENVETYGSDSSNTHVIAGGAIEDVMQDILDNWAAGVTLYSPNGTGGTPFNAGDSPGFTVTYVEITRQSVMDSLLLLANAIGYEVRYRWHPNTSAFQLQLYEPDRSASSADRTFGPGTIKDVKNLEVDVKRIRNAVLVEFYTDANDPTTKDYVEVADAVSIAQYGRRWAAVAEPQGSPIDTTAEATDLATAIVSDLKEPDRDQQLEFCHYFPHGQLADYYTFQADGIHYTSAQSWGVQRIDHVLDLDGGYFSTTIQTRGKPSSGFKKWWDRLQLPGVAKIWKDLNPSVPTVVLTPKAGGLAIDWTEVVPDELLYYDVFLSTSSGFTPGDSNRLVRTKTTRYEVTNLIPGTTYYVKIQAVDRDGNLSTISTQKTAVAGYSATRIFDPTSNFARSEILNGDFGHRTLPSGTALPDNWEILNGILGTDIQVAGQDKSNARGLWYIQYLNTSTQRQIGTRESPCSAGRLYKVSIKLEGAIASGANLDVNVTWRTVSGPSSDRAHRLTNTTYTSRTWVHAYVTAPSDAYTMKIDVDADSNVGAVDIDEIRVTESLWAFQAKRTATQAIAAATLTVIQFNVEDYDKGGKYDSAANFRFDAPVDGPYRFWYGIGHSNFTNSRKVCFLKNGAQDGCIIDEFPGAANTIKAGESTCKIIPLVAGDYVQVAIELADAGNVVVGVWFGGEGPLYNE